MAAEAEFWKAVKTGDRHAVESLLAVAPRLATARLDGRLRESQMRVLESRMPDIRENVERVRERIARAPAR